MGTRHSEEDRSRLARSNQGDDTAHGSGHRPAGPTLEEVHEGSSASVVELRHYLSGLKPGPLDAPSKARSLLADAWPDLEGSWETNLYAHKVSIRGEDLIWNPPNLEFAIERHGRTVNGSTRADVHHWIVDVEKGTTTWSKGTHRQLYKMNPPLKVQPLAEEIAGLITGESEDDRLRWRPDGSVQVQIGKVIPGGGVIPAQTTGGRRKRFRKALEEILDPKSWEVVRSNVYRRRG